MTKVPKAIKLLIIDLGESARKIYVLDRCLSISEVEYIRESVIRILKIRYKGIKDLVN